jgi:hypothetical protein
MLPSSYYMFPKIQQLKGLTSSHDSLLGGVTCDHLWKENICIFVTMDIKTRC